MNLLLMLEIAGLFLEYATCPNPYYFDFESSFAKNSEYVHYSNWITSNWKNIENQRFKLFQIFGTGNVYGYFELNGKFHPVLGFLDSLELTIYTTPEVVFDHIPSQMEVWNNLPTYSHPQSTVWTIGAEHRIFYISLKNYYTPKTGEFVKPYTFPYYDSEFIA